MMESMRTASRNTRFDKWLDAIGEPDHQNVSEFGTENRQPSVPSTKPCVQAPLAEVAQYLRSRGECCLDYFWGLWVNIIFCLGYPIYLHFLLIRVPS